MTIAFAPLIGHVGHWFEAAMFAPAVLLVVTVSIRSILERRAQSNPMKENRHD
jgi:hypothetical protein